MNNDLNNIIRIVLNLIIVSLIIYVVAKLFIFLLPVIIVLIIIYYLYRIFEATKNKVKINNKTKKDNIQDAEVINEKFDK